MSLPTTIHMLVKLTITSGASSLQVITWLNEPIGDCLPLFVAPFCATPSYISILYDILNWFKKQVSGACEGVSNCYCANVG